jgi:peptide/nickel transport system substrate-binding protein
MRKLLIIAAVGLSAAFLGVQAQQDVFTIAFQGGATTLDPITKLETLTINWQQYIFDTVTRYDRSGRIKPGIAQAWRSEGQNKWVFILRRGIKFHDGSSLTSSDVAYSINRALNDPKSLFKNSVQAVKTVTAPNAQTVEIITERSDPLLPTHLGAIAVVSKKQLETNPNWAEKPIGSGPYKFVSWLAQDNLVLEANKTHWDGAPTIGRIKLQSIPNASARVAALISNQVQLAEKIAPQDVARLSSTSGYAVSQLPGQRTIYLALDLRKTDSPGVGDGPNPLANAKVREAIARAIDKDLIVKTIMGGYATPATQFVAPFVDGFDRGLRGLTYNPELAKKLLAEAGYPNGFSLRFDSSNDRYLNDALIAQAIGGMLDKIGIKTKVNAVSRTVLTQQFDKGDFSMYLAGWGSSDLVNTLVAQVMCKNREQGYGTINRVGYCNPEIDKLVLRASSTFSAAERKKLVSQVMRQVLLNDKFWIPLHYENVIHGYSSQYIYKARGDEYIYAWEIDRK